MPSVLITGGAGYIGSVSALAFLEAGWDTFILDDLSRGHRAAVPPGARLYPGDICDRQDVRLALQLAEPDCVLHCAALAYVGESFDRPQDYFRINIGGTANLLAAMVDNGVERIVFSSSCTVYGEPLSLPIDENEPVKPPVSPYGQSKQACEQMLDWMVQTNGLSTAALRYFNAAGAWSDFGEDHRPETHLIPIAIDAALGNRGPLEIYGNDYSTPDGTCIRDYIHIYDLAQAHLLAADHLLAHPKGTSLHCNLGTGQGHSIMQVIDTVTRITGKPVPHTIVPRRPGDAPKLVAANNKATQVLGWTPQHSDLNTIITHAHNWRLTHSNGYPTN
jgi:UDP-glucose-4-epimerase GalE